MLVLVGMGLLLGAGGAAAAQMDASDTITAGPSAGDDPRGGSGEMVVEPEDAVQGAIDAAEDAGHDAVSKTADGARAGIATAKEARQDALTTANEAGKQAQDTAREAAGTAQGAAADAYEAACAAPGAAARAVDDAVKDAYGDLRIAPVGSPEACLHL